MSPDPSSARVFRVPPFTPTSHLPCHRQFKREKYLVRAILQIWLALGAGFFVPDYGWHVAYGPQESTDCRISA